YVQQPRNPPFGSLNSCGSICRSFCVDSRGAREENTPRAEWTEVGSYACMRLETFGERGVSHDLPSLCAILAGVSGGGAGALNTFSAFAKNMPPGNGTRVIACESFCVSDAGQVPHLRSYIADTLLPCMDQLRNIPRMCLEAIVAPHTPQVLLLT